jgi:hypothetical protein
MRKYKGDSPEAPAPTTNISHQPISIQHLQARRVREENVKLDFN